MRIYVATATPNIDAAEHLIYFIEHNTEHTITYDWTKQVRRTGREKREHPDEDIERAAMGDTGGVAVCNLFILLWHPEVYGALIETGMALIMCKPIWIVHPHPGSVKFVIFFKMRNNHARFMTGEQCQRILKYGDQVYDDSQIRRAGVSDGT